MLTVMAAVLASLTAGLGSLDLGRELPLVRYRKRQGRLLGLQQSWAARRRQHRQLQHPGRDTSGALAGKTLTAISAGIDDTCALDSTGANYCWGWNEYGELSDGKTADSSLPVAVDTSGALAGRTLTQVTTSADHTCAVDVAGAAYCWGDNQFGQLGDDDNIDAQSDVPVLAGPQAPAASPPFPATPRRLCSGRPRPAWTAS